MTRRTIPSTDKVLKALGLPELPRALVVTEVRRELELVRRSLSGEPAGRSQAGGEVDPDPDFDAVVARVRSRLENLCRSRLQPVINATGVIIHTNLGRAPLGPAVAAALDAVAQQYSNLEFDLNTGNRGSRGLYVEHCLAQLCGAGAATVVNNCAAALVLMLRHFTQGDRKEVVISRGELVQIGGGFRIPDILETSGAILREVGTTNRTDADDYARALSPQTALILKVHRSNFFMGGFVESPGTADIAAVARRRRVPFIEDLGSGAVIRTGDLGLADPEPTPAGILKQGVDLVCFSGDKLLGGPQAGIIAGRTRFVGALKRDPFFRALRCDKLILAALQTTVESCLEATSSKEPGPLAWALIRTPVGELRRRAEQLRAALAESPLESRISRATARIGGGTLPRTGIESITLDLKPSALPVVGLAAQLRDGNPPVIGHLAGGWLRLDLRTVLPEQDEKLAAAVRSAVPPHRPPCFTGTVNLGTTDERG
ncbi:MAG: L-seryl-tRNA(Sec) selenium transferase [Verrucomicrobiales bacterium]|nr:L-seryl-tRNA(Sec) selenium transferase [Verrucomicrobiales bacterium]